MRRLLLASAAALALASCAGTDMGGMSDAMPADMAMPVAAMAYAGLAAESDLYEITSSQMALQRSQNPRIREFAQMLITHHTQTTAGLTAAARAAGMTPPPPVLGVRKQAMINELNAAGTGAAFDAVYLRQQVPAHQEALALHSNYRARGDTPTLRRAAGTAIPLVRRHLRDAQRMHGAM